MNRKESLLLAIETSCDETSAAVVRNGQEILSNIISSQIAIHGLYGGVVPEIASRKHLENLVGVVDLALAEAGVKKDEITEIGVTYGPGLVGALLVGVSLAKSLAYALGIPLIPVHHLLGHMYANLLSHPKTTFPLLCLVVSGGHTSIIYWRDHGDMEILGETRDDAAGEAFDKVARVLGLGYPGGPAIEAKALSGNPRAIDFPRAYLEKDSLDFSFSGLKSSVINYLHTMKQKEELISREDVSASFQEALIEVLVEKTLKAALLKNVKTVALAGGVAGNKMLQETMRIRLALEGIQLIYPQPVLCTDNAAMIGAAAYHLYQAGRVGSLDLNAVPHISIHG